MKPCAFRVSTLAALAAATMTMAPDAAAQVVLDGTVGRAGALAGPRFSVTADLGRQVGANLFHSFSQFSIAQGERATFSGPAGVANIISRVTGGGESVIDGRLASTIAGADFFLFNPAGVAFGPNASINVGGAFHASTAHYLRLADGGRFDAASPGSSTLTAAAPAAFGFLGGQGPLMVEGSSLRTAGGAAISLVGGDVGIGSGALVAAPSGAIGIASVTGAGEVTLGADGIANPAGSRGTIVIADAWIYSDSASGRPAGPIRIAGGDVVVADGASIEAYNESALPGGGITVDATGTVLLSSARLYTNTYPSAGASGEIRVTAPTVVLENESSINAQTMGPGNAGGIAIEARDLEVRGDSRISTTSYGGGNAGPIRVNASRSVLLEDGGNLSASGNYEGAAGDIAVQADVLAIDNGFIASTVWGTGGAGSITLDVGDLALRSGFVSASGSLVGTGDGGDVTVRATRGVTIEGYLAGLSTGTADGKGGNVFVSSPVVVLDDNGSMSSSTYGRGRAGDITLDVGELRLGEFAYITASSSAIASGDGGNIAIRATDRVLVSSGPFGGLDANTFGSGRGGSISIVAPRVDLVDGKVGVASLGSGDAGSITIRASEHLVIEADRFSGGVYGDTNGPGKGGDMFIATPRLEIRGAGGIGATSMGAGAGGSITIEAGTVGLEQGSQIRTFTTGPGRGGFVDIHAGEIGLAGGSRIIAFSSGDGDGGDVILRGDRSIRIAGDGGDPTTGIAASSEGAGAGGNVRLAAPAIEITDVGFVSAGARDRGRGGSVVIDAGALVVSRLGFIDVSTSDRGAAGSLTVRATDSVTVTGSDGSHSTGLSGESTGSGAGGSITIQAPRVVVDDGATLSSITRDTARGGSILIEAGDLAVRGGAAINASSLGAGRAGDVVVRASGSVVAEGGGYGYVSGIAAQSLADGAGGHLDIAAPRVEVRDGALITTESFGTGAAGSIRIAADEALAVVRGGAIATRTVQSDGGDIRIEGRGVVQLSEGSITTSVQGGAGNGGNITIAVPEHVVLIASSIQANAYGGNGGNVAIDSSYFIASPGSVVEASSQLGVSGRITVTAPAVDIGAGLGVLPAGYFDAARLLREACASRAGESENSFVVVGRGALPESAWGAYPSRRERREPDKAVESAAPSGRMAVGPCGGMPE